MENFKNKCQVKSKDKNTMGFHNERRIQWARMRRSVVMTQYQMLRDEKEQRYIQRIGNDGSPTLEE